MNLLDPFLERARRTPSRVFAHLHERGAWDLYTYGDLLREARRIAGCVASAGVQPGEVVPIVLDHRRDLYSCFLGIMLADAVPAILAPLTRKQDPAIFTHGMQSLIARVDPPLIIGSRATLPVITSDNRTTLDVDNLSTAAMQQRGIVGSGSDIAFLQHSSGTTGLKKGVRLSHSAPLRQVEIYAAAINLTDRDIIASWLPLYHDMGLITSFLMPLVTGVPVVSLDALEWVLRPALLLDAIALHRATLSWLPNFAFHHIANLARPELQWDLSSLRMLINCSEPCRATAFDTFAARFAGSGLRRQALQVSYAMAENVFAVTQTAPGSVVPRSVRSDYPGYLSCGRALKGTRVRIRTSDGAIASEGVLGEILIASDCLFSGYDKLPDLTEERLSNGWYATGDLGFLDADELFVVGRTDDLININGRKIIAHEVEACLNAVTGIALGRVLVYGVFDEASGAARLIVAAERSERAASGNTLEDTKIHKAVRLSVFANCGIRPAYISLLDRGFLLKSTSGKISRRASIEKLDRLQKVQKLDRLQKVQ